MLWLWDLIHFNSSCLYVHEIILLWLLVDIIWNVIDCQIIRVQMTVWIVTWRIRCSDKEKTVNIIARFVTFSSVKKRLILLKALQRRQPQFKILCICKQKSPFKIRCIATSKVNFQRRRYNLNSRIGRRSKPTTTETRFVHGEKIPNSLMSSNMVFFFQKFTSTKIFASRIDFQS